MIEPPHTSLASETPRLQPRGSARRWAVMTAIGALAVTTIVAVIRGLLGLLTAAALHSAVTNTEALTRQQIESIGQFKFPAGATDIRSRYVSWMDFTLQVKFSLPPDEVNALLDSTRVRRPLSSMESAPFLPGPVDANDWWRPGTPATFEAGASVPNRPTVYAPQAVSDPVPEPPATEPALRQFILIDRTNPRLYTVWLYVSG